MTGQLNPESNPFDPSWPFDPDLTMQLNTWLEERHLELAIARTPAFSFLGFYLTSEGRTGERVGQRLVARGGEADAIRDVLKRGLH
jgi:hypothetical protein